MKALIVAATLAATLSGACTTTKPTYLADGRQGHRISCNGAIRSFSNCLSKAGEICKEHGYDVVGAWEDKTPVALALLNSQTSASANSQRAAYNSSTAASRMAGSAVSRSILLACRT